MSRYEKVTMYGVDHVVGEIKKYIDIDAAQLMLENTLRKKEDDYVPSKEL